MSGFGGCWIRGQRTCCLLSDPLFKLKVFGLRQNPAGKQQLKSFSHTSSSQSEKCLEGSQLFQTLVDSVHHHLTSLELFNWLQLTHRSGKTYRYKLAEHSYQILGILAKSIAKKILFTFVPFYFSLVLGRSNLPNQVSDKSGKKTFYMNSWIGFFAMTRCCSLAGCFFPKLEKSIM